MFADQGAARPACSSTMVGDYDEDVPSDECVTPIAKRARPPLNKAAGERAKGGTPVTPSTPADSSAAAAIAGSRPSIGASSAASTGTPNSVSTGGAAVEPGSKGGASGDGVASGTAAQFLALIPVAAGGDAQCEGGAAAGTTDGAEAVAAESAPGTRGVGAPAKDLVVHTELTGQLRTEIIRLLRIQNCCCQASCFLGSGPQVLLRFCGVSVLR